MMTREDFFRDTIATWEGGLSLDPDDAGNWLAVKGHAPVLVGSCHGVTGAALARFRGCAGVARADIAALTLDEAARVGERLFYREPDFDLLPWDALVASMVDFGWGVGPRQAALVLQRLIGAADDGAIGPYSVSIYRQFVAHHGLEPAAQAWHAARDDFYRLVVARRPVNAKYLRGWLRRSAWFLPGGAWWRRFTATAEAA